MFADNCHVHVHLHESEKTNTAVAGQIKAHVLQNGGLVISNDINSTYVYGERLVNWIRRQFHVDAVWDKKLSPTEMCNGAHLANLADAALEGCNTAVLMLGVTRGSSYRRYVLAPERLTWTVQACLNTF